MSVVPSPGNSIRLFWSKRSPLAKRAVVGIIGLLALVASVWFGRHVAMVWGRRSASERLEAGAVSQAMQWLSWCRRLAPDDAPSLLLEASCHRHMGQETRWSEALQIAQDAGVPEAIWEQERKLGLIHFGRFYEGAEVDIGELIAAGVSPQDVVSSFVAGYLTLGQHEKAVVLLQGVSQEIPEKGQQDYLWARYYQELGKSELAIEHYEAALSALPDHEFARVRLAEIYEEAGQLDHAAKEYRALLARSPRSEFGMLGQARQMRRMARVNEAREILSPLADKQPPLPEVLEELAEIALEAGEYGESLDWLAENDFNSAGDRHLFETMALASALESRTIQADSLLAELATQSSLDTRSYDLQVRLAIYPSDMVAAEELQDLLALARDSGGRIREIANEQAEVASSGQTNGQANLSARDLYTLHCAACHGETGNGGGRAARHLHPKPRDFGDGVFKLVSTDNQVASIDDLENTIRKGMPGTSMPAFDELSDDERRVLAEEVVRLTHARVRERVIALSQQEEEAIDQEEVDATVQEWLVPGAPLKVPAIGSFQPDDGSRGKTLFARLGCVNCHGETGRGNIDEDSRDDRGLRSRPRDLVYEPLKGGPDPGAVYLRIVAGMPGSPHPACPGLSEQEYVDLVQYCSGLSKEPKHLLTNHQRALLNTSRKYLNAVAPTASE